MELATLNQTSTAALVLDSMRSDLLGAWLAQRSPNTVSSYRADLRALAGFLGVGSAEAALDQLCAAGETGCNGLLLAWRTAREAEGLAPATIARGLTAARSVLRLAKRVGRISWTPDVDAPRVEPVEDRSGPAAPIVAAMLDAARSHDDARTAARNGAILALLAGLGLRRAEALALDVAHLDLAGSTLRATCKGKRGRDLLALPAGVRDALAAWLACHPTGAGALLVGLDRSARAAGFPRLSAKSLARIVATLGELAGATSRVRAHGLRHSFATAALEAGADLRGVAGALRHANLSTVARYDDAQSRAADRARRLGAAALGL